MKSFFKYILNNKHNSFDELPFNIVDALILVTIVYLPFFKDKNDLHTCHTVNDLLNSYLSRKDKINITFSRKLDKKYALLLKDSIRYSSLTISDYIQVINLENEEQFSALTIVDKEKIFVTFMGTDTSLVGWKEDFNLSYKHVIPSQVSAVKYLDEIASKYKDKTIFVGGHSKGGNLAMYASIFANRETQKRIKKVFNFDGPGLLKEVMNTKQYFLMKNKIISILPSTSFVGVIFDKSVDCLIIKSKGLLMANHLYYNYDVKNNDFVYEKRLSKFSLRMHLIMKYIMDNLNDEEKSIFIDEMYKIVTSTSAYNVFDLFKITPKAIKDASISILSINETDKKVISKALKIVYKGIFEYSKEMVEFDEINSKWLYEDK